MLADAEMFVVVEAVNDAPSVVCPTGTIVLEEDAGPTNIPGVYVTDPDAHETTGGVMEVSWSSEMKQADAAGAEIVCKRVILRGWGGTSCFYPPTPVETARMAPYIDAIQII